MKSNVFDIRTKERVDFNVPRNTFPGGILISLSHLIAGIEIDGARCHLVGGLKEYAQRMRVPQDEIGTLVFIFDRKNSKSFLVKDLRDKAEGIFEGQVMFE